MTDYNEQLNVFAEEETRGKTEAYFEKYWLSRDDYDAKWIPIQNSIFRREANCFPDMMFNSGFQLIPLEGGVIFIEEEFILLQNCMTQIGDESFAIIQNENAVEKVYYGENDWRVHPPLRFIFPSNISWGELNSGGLVSEELFHMPSKEYFVFGNTGTWGKYVANDEDDPLDIIGFQKQYADIFLKQFADLIESEVVDKWLPDSYKKNLASPRS